MTAHGPPRIAVERGDCRDVLPRLDRGSAQLLLTDPPYFLDGLDNAWRKGGRDKPRGTGSVGGLPSGMKFDAGQARRLRAFAAEAGELTLPVLAPGAYAAVFSQPRLYHGMALGLEDAGFEVLDILAWRFTRSQFKAMSLDHFVAKMNVPDAEKERIRQSIGGRKTPQLKPTFEAIVLARTPGEPPCELPSDPLAEPDPGTVLFEEKSRKDGFNHHLTVKPAPLIERLIRLFSAPGATVLDPFLGSGTTAVAALRAGRSCIGIEIEDEYADIAERRLSLQERGGTQGAMALGG